MTVEQKVLEAEYYVTSHTDEILKQNNALISAHNSFIAGYDKANEWHYVKNGDLPKHGHEVLCLLWGGIKEIGYYKNKIWYFEDFTTDYDDVDYWQEIIPPKETE